MSYVEASRRSNSLAALLSPLFVLAEKVMMKLSQRRAIAELRQFDSRMLADIGVTQYDLEVWEQTGSVPGSIKR